MHHLLSVSTALFPLGLATQRKLHRVNSGPYAGRLVALMQTSPTEIKLSWAAPPYTSWSAPLTIASDAADLTFDSLITAAGDLHLVYCEQTTIHLVTRKLTFSSGSWSIGSKVVIYNGTQCYEPSLAQDSTGKLWVAYGRFVSPNRTIHVKSSADSGASWGSGASDAGASLDLAAATAYPRLLVTSTHLYCFASIGGTNLYVKSMPFSSSVWGDPVTLFTGTSLGGDFDVALSGNGIVGVALSHTSLQYREYDGQSWAAAQTIDSLPGAGVQLSYVNSVAVATWLKAWQGTQLQPMYSARNDGVFAMPKPLDPRNNLFDSVLLYDASAGSYVNRTTEAASSATADVSHPSSSALLKDLGDILYLGMATPFRYLTALLSTTGIGGACAVSYHDGVNWRQFTPVSGTINFATTTTQIQFWNSYAALPLDWQRSAVNGEVRFWLKLEVTTPFSTAPVASRLASISDAVALSNRH